MISHPSGPNRLPACYLDNPLIDACGPLLSDTQVMQKLLHLPALPDQVQGMPASLRDHHLMDAARLHLPTPEGLRLAQSVSLMIRQGYVHRRPSDPSTWRRLYEPNSISSVNEAVQLAGTLVGLSGVGKTRAVERALSLFPQVVTHSTFPGIVGDLRQLLWLKVDVPPSGKLPDLVQSLAIATNEALNEDRCSELLAGRRRSGTALAFEWLQKISCNFLGILVLDEVQNLFKIQTKAARQSATRLGAERPALRIIDDEMLKLILTLSNRSKIPTLLCATPDGFQALSTRMSTARRLVTGGHHEMLHYASADDPFFSRTLLPKLWNYQWLDRQVPIGDELRKTFHELSGGVLGIGIALWIHAQRRAISRRALEMSVADLKHAAEHALAPLGPAVRALLSGDPRAQLRYEDLLPTSY